MLASDSEVEVIFGGVILSGAVLQAERRISRDRLCVRDHARSLAPLVKTRGFGMTH